VDGRCRHHRFQCALDDDRLAYKSLRVGDAAAREFIAGLSVSALSPILASAQQAAMRVIGFSQPRFCGNPTGVFGRDSWPAIVRWVEWSKILRMALPADLSQ
jgi:hypothetical protein